MKLQLWLTEQDRDLLETALKTLTEQADAETVHLAGKKCRGFVIRRINEMLKRLEKK